MSIEMALIYIAGMISGAILVIIMLAGWIHHAALKIKEKNSGASSGTDSSAPSMANNYTNRYQRNRRTFTTPA